jgi:hypothetical protein
MPQLCLHAVQWLLLLSLLLLLPPPPLQPMEVLHQTAQHLRPTARCQHSQHVP